MSTLKTIEELQGLSKSNARASKLLAAANDIKSRFLEYSEAGLFKPFGVTIVRDEIILNFKIQAAYGDVLARFDFVQKGSVLFGRFTFFDVSPHCAEQAKRLQLALLFSPTGLTIGSGPDSDNDREEPSAIASQYAARVVGTLMLECLQGVEALSSGFDISTLAQ